MVIIDAGETRRTITAITIRDAGNSLRAVTLANARDAGNVIRVAFTSGGQVTVSPSEVSGYGYSKVPIAVSTGSVTATYNGSGSPTIAWAVVSGGSAWSVINPTSFSTAFRRTGVEAGGDYTGSFQGTITVNGTAYLTQIVTAEVMNTYA